MTDYLIKGKLSDIVDKILSAHIEMKLSEEDPAVIEALIQDKNFATHLFYEGRLIIDNFCIDECKGFEEITYEEIGKD